MTDRFDFVKLKEGVNIQELIRGGSQHIVLDEGDVGFCDVSDIERSVDTCYEYDDYKDRINFNATSTEVEGIATTPFESFALEMTDVTRDGKIKKKVLQTGKEPIADDAVVYVNYDLYIEMQEIPVDSSSLRLGRPERVNLSKGNHIRGFGIAIKSMTVGEKATFLIHHDYAFLKFGAPPRIPAEAEIFAVIEVVGVVDSNSPLEGRALDHEERKVYSAVSDLAKAHHELGKGFFKSKSLGCAICHYEEEEALLVGCSGSASEEEERKARLFTVYLNLSICHNHASLRDYSKALSALGKALTVNREKALKTAKFFYNRAVAREGKGLHQQADADFKKAALVEPNNTEIAKRHAALLAKLKVAKKLEKRMSVKTFGDTASTTQPPTDDDDPTAESASDSSAPVYDFDPNDELIWDINPGDWDVCAPELEYPMMNNLSKAMEKYFPENEAEQEQEASNKETQKPLGPAEDTKREQSSQGEEEETPLGGTFRPSTPFPAGEGYTSEDDSVKSDRGSIRHLDDEGYIPDEESDDDPIKRKFSLPADDEPKKYSEDPTVNEPPQRMAQAELYYDPDYRSRMLPSDDTVLLQNLEKWTVNYGDEDDDEEDEEAKSIAEFMQEILQHPAGVTRNLGYGFTPKERAVYKRQAERFGLIYEEHGTGALRTNVIIKKPTADSDD